MKLQVILQIVQALIGMLIKDADGNGKIDLLEKEKEKDEVQKQN